MYKPQAKKTFLSEFLPTAILDNLLLLFSSLIFIVAIFQAIKNESESLGDLSQNKDLKELATVTLSNNDVRRKIKNNLTWYPIKTQDKIYEQDSIFTGQNSEVEITFLDGSKLL